ncbi:hypothetical protein [Campylobacter devanensis]|uniref:hypothetical protein n=1 Tax=Campylobacter devanensis TaxID=3161138 RepID=UPI000A34C351|nr:hypothetical protein [Campylobacter sp. P159]
MISKDLQTKVEARDFNAIRLALGIGLQFDQNVFGNFTEIVGYCKAKGIELDDLYQEHDGRSVDLEATKDNFAELIGQLSTNFSRQRLEKVLEITQAVWPEKQKKITVQTVGSSNNFGESSIKNSNNSNKFRVEREIPKNNSSNAGEHDRDGARIISRRPASGNVQRQGSHQRQIKSASANKKDVSTGSVLLAVAAAAALVAAIFVLA